MRRFHIYRYDPELDAPPRMQACDFEARDDERQVNLGPAFDAGLETDAMALDCRLAAVAVSPAGRINSR